MATTVQQHTTAPTSPATPTVSVVIPAYKQADYLSAAIESVLQQSYPHWELLVVNDASPDHTNEVVACYLDPRIKLINHESNRGLPGARNSGIRAATGEIIALLDADDLFHVDKLQAHVEFLNANPQVDVSYNARYEISDKGDILSIWRPATVATFRDLVMGFPFAPSDMVLRREWAFRVDLFDESYRAMSEDLDINCRLALAGCRFGGIDQPLNYRRYYGNRVIRNVPDRVAGAERALNALFDNPACPPEILALKPAAFANLYLVWSYEAFMAALTVLGQQWLSHAVALNPALSAEGGVLLQEFLIDRSIQDGGDHALAIHQVVDQLPKALKWMETQVPQTVARADLRAGIRELLWGRQSQGELLLRRAMLTGATVEQDLLRLLVDQLLNYRTMLGEEAAEAAMQRLTTSLHIVVTRRELQWLKGCYQLNCGFDSYRQQAYRAAQIHFFKAFGADPRNLRNRGAWATLLRALQSQRQAGEKSSAKWSPAQMEAVR